MEWFEKLYANKKQYNCFECHSFNKKCRTYIVLRKHEGPKCTYKGIAETDMVKHLNGNPNITLKTMLEQYLNNNGEN